MRLKGLKQKKSNNENLQQAPHTFLLFGLSPDSLGFPQPHEMLVGHVHFKQHIHHELIDRFLNIWRMAFWGPCHIEDTR